MSDYSGYPSSVPEHVAAMFEDLAFQVWERGFDRYSADAVLHRIRWFHHVERGDREFKCNNNWTSGLARAFMKKYPSMNGFFEIRVLKKRPWDEEGV